MLPAPRQRPPLPRRPRPIIVIGAGGIVRDAHLPAYRLAGFPVCGIADRDTDKARALTREFGVPQVFASVAEAVREAPAGAVYDVAVPAAALAELLAVLPDGAAVLIQKPLGENLAQARALGALCHRKRLLAAVNFQLRYAPAVLAARDLIDRGLLGEVHDIEVRVTVHTPWQLWTFLEQAPRVELLYHSIHYIDLIRSFWGDPRAVQAKTARHPRTLKLAPTRSAVILDYGDLRRATITANHGHDFGPEHQESYVKWEGTAGAIKARLGLLLDYPRGVPDRFEFCATPPAGATPRWESVELEGSWYPHAFIGTMASLMRAANGETSELPTAIDDAIHTMAVVEAAYEASARGGVIPDFSSP